MVPPTDAPTTLRARVEYNKNGTTGVSTLSDADLETLNQAIDGPELRVALRDGISCDPPPTDVSVRFRLDLSGSAFLERDATGCALSGPEGNVLWRTFRLVTAY